MIIGINGKIGSGKDTVAQIIQYLDFQKHIKDSNSSSIPSDDKGFEDFCKNPVIYNWQIKKFAYKLKQTASILTGIAIEKFEDQEFKKTSLGQEWSKIVLPATDNTYEVRQDLTVRELLQKLGTEAIRDNIHQNTWVNALFADYKPTRMVSSFPPPVTEEEYITQQNYPDWIITDVRFENEAEAIKARNGVIIQIKRKETDKLAGNHPSETSLDNWNFDYQIENNGTIEELIEKVKTVLTKINETTSK